MAAATTAAGEAAVVLEEATGMAAELEVEVEEADEQGAAAAAVVVVVTVVAAGVLGDVVASMLCLCVNQGSRHVLHARRGRGEWKRGTETETLSKHYTTKHTNTTHTLS